MKQLRDIALTGNVVFILWVLFNAMDEGFQGVTRVQVASYIGLICLLALNIFLLVKQK